MSVVVVGERGYAQVIHTGGHELRADEPASHNGTDTGPAPYDLLLAALGACTSITLRMVAEKKGWDLGRVEVRLRHAKDADGKDVITRELSFGAPLTEEQRHKLLEVSDKTPVTKTLRAGAAINTTLL